MGRWLGVELRVHVFFPLLALVCVGLSAQDGIGRGLALFAAVCGAVLAREGARLLVAVWFNLRLRAILLLPTGGLFAYANPESQENSNSGWSQFLLMFAGPFANLTMAVAVGAAFMGAGGDVHLFAQPLVSSNAIIRSTFWIQAGLGLLHLIPAYPMDAGRFLKGTFAKTHGLARAGRAATGIGQLLALIIMIGGWVVLHSPWVMIAGFFIMIGSQVEDQGAFFQTVVDTVRMSEVMLTDFATLSASDTLADALGRCVHSLQEDFPVVRGPQLVGIVNRQRIIDALRNDGDGYIQSIMSKGFQVARPEDTLGAAIRRLSAGKGMALIPVTEAGRVVGIVSVQNLMSSMTLLSEQRRVERSQSED